VRSASDVAAIVRAVAPKPVNVLVSGDYFTVRQLAEIGVRRISVGGALARSALTGFLNAAKEIAGEGTFTALSRTISVPELNGLFSSIARHGAC
jgi:methylisocitrate lyase